MNVLYNFKLLMLPFLGGAFARVFVYYTDLLTAPTSIGYIKFCVGAGGFAGFMLAFALYVNKIDIEARAKGR